MSGEAFENNGWNRLYKGCHFCRHAKRFRTSVYKTVFIPVNVFSSQLSQWYLLRVQYSWFYRQNWKTNKFKRKISEYFLLKRRKSGNICCAKKSFKIIKNLAWPYYPYKLPGTKGENITVHNPGFCKIQKVRNWFIWSFKMWMTSLVCQAVLISGKMYGVKNTSKASLTSWCKTDRKKLL